MNFSSENIIRIGLKKTAEKRHVEEDRSPSITQTRYTIASRYYRHRKVVTDARGGTQVCPLGVDALSLAAVAHANRSLCLLRLGVAKPSLFREREVSREKLKLVALSQFFERSKVTAFRTLSHHL